MQYNNKSYIYQDEPISSRNKSDGENLPQEIKKVRLLENTLNIIDQRNQKLFCLQGKILENYEDTYEYDDIVYHYYPTYQTLNNNELRGYFTWRTNYRKGSVRKTWLAYVFLYIYELLNQIGVKSPLDGFYKLKAFEMEYSRIEPIISKYMKKWMNDYVIYYNLDFALLEDSKEILYDKNIIVLDDIDNYTDSQIMDALNFLSTYKITNSPLYKKNPKDFSTIIVNCFKRINTYYNNHHKNTLVRDYFEYSDNVLTVLFINSVFFDTKKIPNGFEYKISDIRKYKYINSNWYVTGYNVYKYPNRKLAALLKTIDSLYRKHINYSRPIKQEINLKWLNNIVNEEFDLFDKNKKEEKIVKIDFSQLNTIRKDSDITREKLITEEEIEDEIEIVQIDKQKNNENNTLLDNNEYRLMQCLLYNLDYSWINKEGLMLSVLVDNINEKLYDEFNDTVLIYEDSLEIIEDYIEELKGIIKL